MTPTCFNGHNRSKNARSTSFSARRWVILWPLMVDCHLDLLWSLVWLSLFVSGRSLQLERSPVAGETNTTSFPPCLSPNKSTLLANAEPKSTHSLSRLFLAEIHPSGLRHHLPLPPKMPWINSPRHLGLLWLQTSPLYHQLHNGSSSTALLARAPRPWESTRPSNVSPPMNSPKLQQLIAVPPSSNVRDFPPD